ncbi:hypothetical protein Tco_0667007 [Tanacetum coccineum]
MMSVDEAIGRLKTFEERIKSKKKIPVDSQESLMFTQHEGQRKPFRKWKITRSLKKITRDKTPVYVTDVTRLDTDAMNVQTNARIKLEKLQFVLRRGLLEPTAGTVDVDNLQWPLAYQHIHVHVIAAI